MGGGSQWVRVMVVPRKGKDSTVSTGESHKVKGWVGLASSGSTTKYYDLHCLESVELQVVVTAPGHQMVNLPPVGAFIPTRD